MDCVKYSSLKDNTSGESVVLYFDKSERKEMLGQLRYGICDLILQLVVTLLWIITLPVTWCFSFKLIPQFERVVVFRLGRVRSLKGPGLVSIIPFIDSWKRVDMRMRAFKVPPQEVITLDHALIKLGADVQYRIVDPITSYTLIQDVDHCLRETGHSVMTTQLGIGPLSDLENNKMSLERNLQLHMNKAVIDWGIEIARFELSTHVIIKKPGGIDPSNEKDDEIDGVTTIMNLIKSFTSGSNMQIPGMMPGPTTMQQMSGMFPSMSAMPVATPIVQPKPMPTQVNSIPFMPPNDLFTLAKGVVDHELCEQVKSIFEFHISNSVTTYIWSLDLKNSPGFVMNAPYKQGMVDVRFTLDELLFQKIFYGLISPTDAYLQGDLKIDGSVKMAKKLELLIRKMQSPPAV